MQVEDKAETGNVAELGLENNSNIQSISTQHREEEQEVVPRAKCVRTAYTHAVQIEKRTVDTGSKVIAVSESNAQVEGDHESPYDHPEEAKSSHNTSISYPGLAHMFSDTKHPITPYTDAEFVAFAYTLHERGSHLWSLVPRLHTVLRAIDMLSLLDTFIDQGML